MAANIVSLDAQTVLVLGILLLIGVILAGFAMVWLYLAWRSASQQHQHASTELATLHQEQETERVAHTRDLEAKQAELIALHSQFNAAQEDLSHTKAEWESSDQRATQLQNRTQILERDLQERQAQAANADRTIADQKLELADLTNQLAEVETQREKIAALESVLQTTRGTVASLTDELTHTQEQAAQVVTLESELQTTRGTVASLTDELARAQEQAAQRKANPALLTELSQVRVRVEEDKTQIAELTSRLNQARARADRVVSDLEQHKIMIAELTHQVHDAQLQTTELSAARNQVEQDKTLLNDLSIQLEQEREKAAQVPGLTEQIAKQQARLAEQKSQLTVTRKKVSPLTRLRKRTEKNRTLIADLKNQVRLNKQQVKTFQKQAQKREAVIVDLTTKLYRIRQDAAENLRLVKGIGPIYAARLRAAGISTLTALANTSATQLREIIQPRKWQKPVFEYWIKQAQRLSRKEKPTSK